MKMIKQKIRLLLGSIIHVRPCLTTKAMLIFVQFFIIKPSKVLHRQLVLRKCLLAQKSTNFNVFVITL